MANSLTLTLLGDTSVLKAQYFPPIELSPTKNYVLGLVELLTYNSIPNIDIGSNKIYIEAVDRKNSSKHDWESYPNDAARSKAWADKVITIPTGSYEVLDIDNYVKKHIPEGFEFCLKENNNELRSEIKCNKPVNFNREDTIAKILGFSNRRLEPNVLHKSDLPVSILKINALRVECNITGGAYMNNQKVHTIHEFFPRVKPGYKIVEAPSQIIYLPVTVKSIHNLQLKIVDQDGKLVNFRGETITIRLHIKAVDK